jgi:hypothetical protein
MYSLYKPLSFLFLFYNILCAYSQNLVPNYDFELNSAYPNNVAQFDLLEDWFNPSPPPVTDQNGSPDYIHTLGTGYANSPNSLWAYVFPQSGNGFVGFAVHNTYKLNYREYASVEFSDTMKAGRNYQLVAHFTNGQFNGSFGGKGISNLGFLFTTYTPVQNGYQPILKNPQILIDSIVYSENWLRFQFEYLPDSNYNFVTIGNFQPDSLLNIESFEQTQDTFVYYFVDSLFLGERITNSINGVERERTEVNISPNPAHSTIQVISEDLIDSWRIFDITGKQIKYDFFNERKNLQIDISGLTNGVYFLTCKNEKGEIVKKFIKQNL